MDDLKLPAEEYVQEADASGKTIYRCTMRQIVMHTIGMNDSCSQRHKPYHRHGRLFYKPWRNCFNTYLDSKPWLELCLRGYAEHGQVFVADGDRPPLTNYRLTRKGLDWLGRELGMTIYNESN
jgi:hypothetical protein